MSRLPHLPRRVLPWSWLILFAACTGPTGVPTSQPAPHDLRCARRVAPLGIGEPRPQLAWRSARRGGPAGGSTAWQVQVAASPHALPDGRGLLWDSGRVAEPGAVATSYGGAELEPRRRYWWTVRQWDGNGVATAWAAPATFTVAPLEAADWQPARWIGAGTGGGEAPTAPWLRHRIRLPAAPADAVLHVSSLGYHDVFVEGDEAGHAGHDVVLAPHVSDLSQRVRVTSYDLTDLLHAGSNTLGLWLGAGWARYPRYGVESPAPSVRALLDVTLPDGTHRTIATSDAWTWRASDRSALGPWGFGNYGGERIDAGRTRPGWATTGDDSAGWAPVTLHDHTLSSVPQQAEPNRRAAEVPVVAVEEIAAEVQRVTFARSFTGITEATLRGEPEATIALTWSERDDQRMTYGQRSELVLDANGRGTFAHRFNYAAGRWLWIDGPVEPLAAGDVRGHLVRTGFRRATRFRCSDPDLQRLHDAAVWTFECLSLGGYVVDCAHRERWGYGGDGHATMETALDHFDLGAFYAKWLDDWRAIQDEHGNLPFTAPTYKGGGGPAWSGIVVMLPWELWRRTGDRALLEHMWPTISAWLAFLETQTEDGLLQFYFDERYTRDVYSFLGDWVPPGGAQVGGMPDAKRRFFNNAYRVWAVRTAARIAAAIGRDAEAGRLSARADELAAAVHAAFYDAGQDRYVTDRQTYWLLPLLAGLGDAPLRARLHARLVADIEQRGHVDTGIHGTWFLTRWLLQQGRDGAALLHRVATQSGEPGWLHMLEQGPGTLWEQWDGINSRMHSSFLSIGAWFVEGLAGIRPLADHPGYARCRIEPCCPPGLDRVDCTLDTVRGAIRCAWRRRGGALSVDVELPPDVTAELRLPWEDAVRIVDSGSHHFAEND